MECKVTKTNKNKQALIEALEHASVCRNANCPVINCIRMRQLIHHSSNIHCKNSSTANKCCKLCKQLIHMRFFHARQCENDNCKVPYCIKIKIKIKQTERTNKDNENQTNTNDGNDMQSTATTK